MSTMSSTMTTTSGSASAFDMATVTTMFAQLTTKNQEVAAERAELTKNHAEFLKQALDNSKAQDTEIAILKAEVTALKAQLETTTATHRTMIDLIQNLFDLRLKLIEQDYNKKFVALTGKLSDVEDDFLKHSHSLTNTFAGITSKDMGTASVYLGKQAHYPWPGNPGYVMQDKWKKIPTRFEKAESKKSNANSKQ